MAETVRVAETPVVHARERGRTDLLLAAGLAFACALIHLQAAIDHFDETALYGAAFVAVAVAQAGWGVLAVWSPGRLVPVAGMLLNLAVLAAWVASRTVGLPVGPDAAGPEAAGLLDVVATLNEIAMVALMAATIGRRRGRAVDALRGAGVLLVLFSSLVLAAGVHAH